MNWVLVLAIALSFLTGVSLTYSLLKQQINQQKEDNTTQIEKTVEQLEKAHESRMQTTINSLRQHYDSQLNQATELLQKEFEVKALNLQQTLEEKARVKALKDFESEKDRLEKTFEEKYRLELIKWKTLYEKSIRKSTLTSSRSIIKGRVSEQLLPLLPGLKYHPGDMRFIGSPIDYIIIDGYDEAKENLGEIRSIILADVKTGNRAKLSPIQLQIKAAVDAGRVRWETILIDKNLQISTSAPSKITRESSVISENIDNINNENADDLSQQIVAWGNTRKIEYISQLISYGYHPNGNVRRLTASAIGKIAASHKLRQEIKQAIPVLGKLTKDEKPQVRVYAVKALSLIASDDVLPFLRRALEDPIGYVNRAANQALKSRDIPF
ncbi:Holliday junction resolvase-like protein [Floridanema aerugineum]|uniref:Holliday junction resolvase-like protein n=1 Tax=Floridaenema aerugineum BLCC-F46 TaxID=3153654 RepID=A0ABV4XH05_9CYAN